MLLPDRLMKGVLCSMDETQQLIAVCEKMMLLRRASMRQLLLRHGLHLGQPEMLLYVQTHPGCSQRQMAEDAGVTAASIAASFKRMENAGLIRRRADTADLRCNRVYITPKGEEELAQCRSDVECLNRSMVEGLDAAEMKRLETVFSLMIHNLSLSMKKNPVGQAIVDE